MVAPFIDRSSASLNPFHVRPSSQAASLAPDVRKRLSIQALAGQQSVSRLASEQGVSRKFIYEQRRKANEALDEAFVPGKKDDDVLFYLPVTKAWIRQLVLALVLVCHSSFRGVVELLRDVFDFRRMSVGTVHNIVRDAVGQARAVNAREELESILFAALDEIFQAGKPVLAGADIESTYCFLLALEAHRCETTWGVHLLDLKDRGLNPAATFADGGQGLRAGQKAAWDDTPCHGDVFHAERELGKLATYLENRAQGCATARDKQERKMERAKKRKKGQRHAMRLGRARQAEMQARSLADDIRTLEQWLRQDILSLAGPTLKDRRDLFDFILEQLRQREASCPHRITPVRRALENQREQLLGFAGLLDEKFEELADGFGVPRYLIQALCELEGMDQHLPAYWEREGVVRQKLQWRFHDLRQAVRQAMAETPRASSIVENLNGRLRGDFFLRRHIGPEYLDLLRFFLNHRRFMRSDRPERVGKTPTELLTGETHAHWLELLGYRRFQLN
jgi:hypothetical protein